MDSLLNNRYRAIKLIGDGAFAEVHLFEDTKHGSPYHPISEETIKHIQVVSAESPEIEFVERESPSKAHQESVEYLKNLDKVFVSSQYTGTESALVAIKICKQNKFNDRDGI